MVPHLLPRIQRVNPFLDQKMGKQEIEDEESDQSQPSEKQGPAEPGAGVQAKIGTTGKDQRQGDRKKEDTRIEDKLDPPDD